MFTELHTNYPIVLNCFVLALGACWGSFLNVVVYRLPIGKSVVFPGSACTVCGTPIHWFDNIPVLSWFILRGKSRCCKTPFSIRYPLVEAFTALLFLACWHAYGPEQWPVVVVGWVLISLLVSGALIDYDTQMLPDVFTVWGMVIGVVLSMLVPALHGLSNEVETITSVYGVSVEVTSKDPALLMAMRGGLHAAIGAVVGAGTLLWIAILAEALLRKEAMGFGDVLLMGCIGAFCGWQGALFAIFGGALIGCVGVAVIALLNKVFGFNLSAGKTSSNGPVALAEQANADTQPQSAHASPARTQDTGTQHPATDVQAQNTVTDTQSQDAVTDAPQLGFGVAIPFGPWLAAGALIYFLFARAETAAYIENLRNLFFPA